MRRRPSRRAGLVAAALLIALAGAFLFVRDSEMVAVERVAVRGASGPDAPKVEAILREVARDMTTLNADADRLREAVSQYPTVDDVALDRDLPHGLTVTVLERRPVALVRDGERSVPVTGGGRLLRGATPPQDLPDIAAADDELGTPRGRRLLAVLAAAPDPVRRKARRMYLGDNGLTLAMRSGPSIYFGTARDLRAKWTAAARILADPTAEGARYVDVRVPERAAAGGLAPLVDSETGDVGEAQPSPEIAPQVVPEPEPEVVPQPDPSAPVAPREAGPDTVSPSTGG